MRESSGTPGYRLPRLLAACVSLTVALALLPSVVGGTAHAQSVDDLRAEQEEAERAAEDAREAQAGVQSDLQEAEQQRDAVAQELTDATAAVDEILTQVDAVTAEQTALRADVTDLTEQARVTRASLAGQIRELYIQGAADDLLLAFDAGLVSDVSSRSHYLTALSRADREDLEELTVITTTLEGRQRQLAAVDAQLADLRADAEATQRELDRQLFLAAGVADDVARALADAEATARALANEADQAAAAVDQAVEAERQAAIAAAEEAARRAEEAAAAAAAATTAARQEFASAPAQAPDVAAAPDEEAGPDSPADGSADDESAPADAPQPDVAAAPAAGGGGKVCPQDNPVSFTDTWGAPRSGGRSHQGTDVFGTRGGNVFAITSGTITRTSVGGLSGLFLILRGDDGNDYWYIHLQDFVASVGDRVSAGQLIAHNGDTGNARGTTPHIHFELHPGGGGPVNPYPLLAGLCL